MECQPQGQMAYQAFCTKYLQAHFRVDKQRPITLLQQMQVDHHDPKNRIAGLPENGHPTKPEGVPARQEYARAYVCGARDPEIFLNCSTDGQGPNDEGHPKTKNKGSQNFGQGCLG